MKYPLIRPLIPPVASWSGHLQEAYRRRYFTNFGPAEQAFGDALLDAFGRPGETCVLCCSATLGLTAALLALDAQGPVAVPAFTFPASLHAILAARLDPVICDVDPASWELSADAVHAALGGRRPGALMPVRAFGFVRALDEMCDLGAELDAPLVIDAAAALGGDRRAGRYPDRYVEVFSLHATKALGIGEGGALFAPAGLRPELERALNFGLWADRSFGYGLNGKMSEFQAAVGLAVLEIHPQLLERRRAMARRYAEHLAGRPGVGIAPDMLAAPCSTYPVLMPRGCDVEAFAAGSLALGAQLRRYYHPSLSQGFHRSGYAADTPVADDLADRMLCLPVYADASPAEIDELIGIFDEAGRGMGLW